MKTQYDFFTIEKAHLKNKKIFPFQIHLFNPINKKYSLFLNGNRPLTNELSAFLDFLLEKGGKIAILKKQRRTFLQAQDIHESEIPSLKSRELHELEKERIMNIQLKEIYDEKNGVFKFKTEFEIAIRNDNFEKIIEYARLEILTFSVTQAPTISLAIELSKKHLIKDTYLNRIVASAYFMAKTSNIDDAVALSDLVCAAYLSHMGYTQLPLNLVRTATLNLNEKEKKLFEKHTILGNHLIKKSQLLLSDRAKKIIYDHHERVNGDGYPAMKSGESIEHLTLILGSISHLFEFSSGKINGNKMPIRSIIINIKNKSFIPGLEFEFGENVYNTLVNLINTDQVETKKIA